MDSQMKSKKESINGPTKCKLVTAIILKKVLTKKFKNEKSFCPQQVDFRNGLQ